MPTWRASKSGALPAPFATVDDAYYAGAGVRNDDLYGAKLNFDITDRVHLFAEAKYVEEETYDAGQRVFHDFNIRALAPNTVGAITASAISRPLRKAIQRCRRGWRRETDMSKDFTAGRGIIGGRLPQPRASQSPPPA